MLGSVGYLIVNINFKYIFLKIASIEIIIVILARLGVREKISSQFGAITPVRQNAKTVEYLSISSFSTTALRGGSRINYVFFWEP